MRRAGILHRGRKARGIAGDAGKITPDALRDDAGAFPARAGQDRPSRRRCRSVQASEAGTVYQPDEIAALAAVAREEGLAVHMDGARFANALVSAGVSPADDDLARRRRRAVARRDEERRARLRGGDLLRSRQGRRLRLSAQARGPDTVEGPIPRRANGGLSDGRVSGSTWRAAPMPPPRGCQKGSPMRRACGWRGRPKPMRFLSLRRANSRRNGAPPARSSTIGLRVRSRPNRAPRRGDSAPARHLVRNGRARRRRSDRHGGHAAPPPQFLGKSY